MNEMDKMRPTDFRMNLFGVPAIRGAALSWAGEDRVLFLERVLDAETAIVEDAGNFVAEPVATSIPEVKDMPADSIKVAELIWIWIVGEEGGFDTDAVAMEYVDRDCCWRDPEKGKVDMTAACSDLIESVWIGSFEEKEFVFEIWAVGIVVTVGVELSQKEEVCMLMMVGPIIQLVEVGVAVSINKGISSKLKTEATVFGLMTVGRVDIDII